MGSCPPTMCEGLPQRRLLEVEIFQALAHTLQILQLSPVTCIN